MTIEIEVRSKCFLGSIAKKWSYVDACTTELRKQICEVLKGLTTVHELSADEFWAVCNKDNVVTALAIDRGATDPKVHKVVGMAMLFIHQKFSPGDGFIEDVVVLDAYGGQGIGKRLMEKLIEIARQCKLPKIELTSNPNNPKRARAIGMYLKMGFKLISQSAGQNGTNLYRLVLAP